MILPKFCQISRIFFSFFLSYLSYYIICMSNHCSKQLDYERPKLVTRPWILDRQLNYFPFKNENHFYVRKERERAQQQRCGKKRNPQKSQGTPIKKVTCSTKKIPIIIWYDILRLRSARWILIGSYVDIEILEVLFFFSIETSLQIK